jgi:hypothetical protein
MGMNFGIAANSIATQNLMLQLGQHNVMVGPTAWAGLEEIARELGYKSRSDLLEAIGRREVTCVSPTINMDE